MQEKRWKTGCILTRLVSGGRWSCLVCACLSLSLYGVVSYLDSHCVLGTCNVSPQADTATRLLRGVKAGKDRQHVGRMIVIMAAVCQEREGRDLASSGMLVVMMVENWQEDGVRSRLD